MPYTFTSWTACTDPASNARTLNWSISAMRGQPAGLYLEALRQAAVLRNSVHAAIGVSDPGGLLTQSALVQADALIQFIDAVAWDYGAVVTGDGWIASAYDELDFSGSADIPAVMDSEAAILTAAGHASRIACPVSPHGKIGLPAEYLVQLYDVLRAKVQYGKQQGLGGALTTYDKRNSASSTSYANAVSSWNAASWVTESWGTEWPRHYYFRESASPYRYNINRRAVKQRWQPISGTTCSDADLYLHGDVEQSGTWDCPDFAFTSANVWLRTHEAQDIGSAWDEWIGRIDTVTIAELPALGYGKLRGYKIDKAYALLNYVTDWVLGA